MPQASAQLRQEWDDRSAQRYLEKRGYVSVIGFRWFAPKDDHRPTAKEQRAINYLINEWDYGGVVSRPPFSAEQCLAYDPFSGDETDVVLVSDKIVTTRKLHQCQHCVGWIAAASHPVRARVEISREERKRMTFYFCPPCCEAMSFAQVDAGRSLERRVMMFKGKNRMVA